MISNTDARKMLAQIDAVEAELNLMTNRIQVLTAEMERLREKLL